MIIKPKPKYCHGLSDHPESQCQRLCKLFNDEQYQFCVKFHDSSKQTITGENE